MRTPRIIRNLVTGAFLALAATQGFASELYRVSVDTTPISGQAGYFAFDLIDVDTLVGNTATITAFSTDATLLDESASGDVTGSLPGPLTLGDRDFFNELLVELIYGSGFSFVLEVSGSGPSAPGPDTFALYLLDELFTPFPTQDPLGTDALMSVEIDSPNPIPQVFASTFANATVTPFSAGVPEPSIAWLLLAGLGSLAFRQAPGRPLAPELGVPTPRRPRGPSVHSKESSLTNPVAPVFAMLALSALVSGRATANLPPASLYYQPPALNTTGQPEAPAGCYDWGGTIQIVSVPVGEALDFRILLGAPAPEDGVTLSLTSDDAGILAIGDKTQAFLGGLHIPEGETLSNPFTVFGNSVGYASIAISSSPPGYGFNAHGNAWDLGDGGEDWLVDANPDPLFLDQNPSVTHCREGDTASLSSDATRLSTCGRAQHVKGAAADGLAPLLMHTRAGIPGQACYEILSTGDLDQGSVSEPVAFTTEVDDVEHSFSFYTPPDEFGSPAGSRTIEVELTYTPVVSGYNANTTRLRRTIELERPPVVLMHGLWGDEGSFKSAFRRSWTFSNLIVERGDYKATNSAPFGASTASVRVAIQAAISRLRGKGYAVNRVDLVGHSMGGLVSRAYLQEPDYRRPENLGEGDVHRFITLGTPHFGSNFANLLIALYDQSPQDIIDSVQSVLGGDAAIDAGAVCSLAENSADLAALGQVDAPAHLVTSNRGPNPPAPGEGASYLHVFPFVSLENELTQTRCPVRMVYDSNRGVWVCPVAEEPVFDQETVDAFRFREENDSIVPITSQLAGVTAGAGTTANFGHVYHSGGGDLWVFHAVSGFTNDGTVADHVFAALDSPASDDLFAAALAPVPSSGLGGPRSVPGHQPPSTVNDEEVYQRLCAVGGPLNPGPAPTAAAQVDYDPRVRIVSPAAGDLYAPGDTIAVEVEVDASIDYVNVIAYTPSGSRYLGGPPFRTELDVPTGFAGTFEIRPMVRDASGVRYLGAPVTVGISPAERPADLLVDEEMLLIIPDHQEHERRIGVLGVFADGRELDLSGSVTSTTYASQDPGVVLIDADGRLTPVASGKTLVTVEHQGLTRSTVVEVAERGVPALPVELTGQVDITRGGIRLDRRTGFFVQPITVANATESALPGPLFLLLTDLTDGVSLVNKDGESTQVAPGSPLLALEPADGIALQPGEGLSWNLNFLDPERKRILYTPKVFRTSSP